MDKHSERLPPELAARERDPHPLTLVLVALALIATSVGLLLFSERVDTAKALINSPASFYEPPNQSSNGPKVVTDVRTILESRNPVDLRERQAALLDVQVQSVPGDFTFWIGSDERHKVPVVLLGELAGRQGELRTQIRPGQRIRVFGVLRLVKGAVIFDQDELLSPEERARVLQSSLYVEALRVEIESPDGQ